MLGEACCVKVIGEPGVLSQSERYFSTPSVLARKVFFYITRCGHYYCDGNYDFRDSCEVGKLDSHRTFLLDYIRRGTMYVEADGKSFVADAGQIALTDCRKPHRFFVRDYAERIWIHFDGVNAEAIFRQIIALHGGKQVFTPHPESRAEGCMTKLVTKLRDVDRSEADVSVELYALLCALLISPVRETAGEETPIGKALSYINVHLFENLSVSEIASYVGLSPSHFSRQFRSRTGFSPHEYIVLHRIDEAKMLLYGTELSVGEIAFRVGYHSVVNFIASFTEKVGMTPTAFRRML